MTHQPFLSRGGSNGQEKSDQCQEEREKTLRQEVGQESDRQEGDQEEGS